MNLCYDNQSNFIYPPGSMPYQGIKFFSGAYDQIIVCKPRIAGIKISNRNCNLQSVAKKFFIVLIFFICQRNQGNNVDRLLLSFHKVVYNRQCSEEGFASSCRNCNHKAFVNYPFFDGFYLWLVKTFNFLLSEFFNEFFRNVEFF